MRVQGLHYDPRWQLVTDAKPILKRVRVVNPPYVTCLSSKPARMSRGLIMSHDIETTTPSGATMQKQGVEPSPYQIRNKDYHIVKERLALSLSTTVRFIWCRLNPRREADPEALHYIVLLGCILVLTLSARQQPF